MIPFIHHSSFNSVQPQSLLQTRVASVQRLAIDCLLSIQLLNCVIANLLVIQIFHTRKISCEDNANRSRQEDIASWGRLPNRVTLLLEPSYKCLNHSILAVGIANACIFNLHVQVMSVVLGLIETTGCLTGELR